MRQPVAAGDPVVAFAPLVLLAAEERWLPMGAEEFIAASGLEWVGGPCRYERDIAASNASRAAAGNRIPPLSVPRLGAPNGYRVRPLRADCRTPRPRVYTTDQRTRPFDTRARPPGLRLDEGFSLDILTDAQPGDPRRALGGVIEGVPVYFARSRPRAGSPATLRVSYWMLFGRGEVADPESGGQGYHEGDWERVEVLLRCDRSRGAHRLVAVRYRQDGRWARRSWRRASLAGPGGTHPVVSLGRGTHVPRIGMRSGRALPWLTWRQLRHVRSERWFGYGGAWGAGGDSDATSGPLGPSPFDVGPDRSLDSCHGVP